MNEMVNKLKKLITKVPLIKPNNKFKLFWDFLVGISMLLVFFTVPIGIAVKKSIH
jgi:hypothetical protein